MAVATQLTVKDIQMALRDAMFDQRNDLVCPNVSWGLLPYEADLLGINKSGQCTEIEIKRSFEDFKKDFEKHHKHDAQQITYFYYAVPVSIVDKCTDYIVKHFDVDTKLSNYSKSLPAILTYTEKGKISRAYEKDGKTLFGNEKRFGYHKTPIEEYAVVGRLVSLRYWDLMREMTETGYFGKHQLKIKTLNETIKDRNNQIEKLKKDVYSDEWHNMRYGFSDKDDVYPRNYETVIVELFGGKVLLAYVKDGEWFDDRNEKLTRRVNRWHQIPK